MALLVYTFSDAPLTWPGIHGRYLIGLLIVTPAILWPLWSGISRVRIRGLSILVRVACGFALVAFCAVLIVGTGRAFGEMPSTQASNAHDQTLINNLERLGVKHVYTDYWTCNKIAFVSNERIICGVVSGQLTPSHNRDSRYYDVVSADPTSAYAFPANTGYNTPPGSNRVLVVEQKLQAAGMQYRRFVLDGYIIYVPEG